MNKYHRLDTCNKQCCFRLSTWAVNQSRFSGCRHKKQKGHSLGCGSRQEERIGDSEGSIRATLIVHVLRSVSRRLCLELLQFKANSLFIIVIIIIMQLYCYPLFVLPSCILRRTVQPAHLEGSKCDYIISWSDCGSVIMILTQSWCSLRLIWSATDWR